MNETCNLAFLLSSLAFVACSSGGLAHRVNPETLTGITEEQTANLARNQQNLENARTLEAKADKDLELARYELEKAVQNKNLVESRVEHMSGIKEAAEKASDGPRVSQSITMLDALEALFTAHKEGVEWLEETVEYFELGVEVARAKTRVADADLESARATVVHQLDLPAKLETPLDQFKIQSADALAEAAKLERESAEKWRAVKEEQDELAIALKKVPDMNSMDKKSMNEDMAGHASDLEKQIIQLKEDNVRLQKTIAADRAMVVPTPEE